MGADYYAAGGDSDTVLRADAGADLGDLPVWLQHAVKFLSGDLYRDSQCDDRHTVANHAGRDDQSGPMSAQLRHAAAALSAKLQHAVMRPRPVMHALRPRRGHCPPAVTAAARR